MSSITRRKSIEIGDFIAKTEPRFGEVIEKFGPCPIGVQPSRVSNFTALAESILGQQLSLKAADTIIKRVKVLAGGQLTPTIVAKLSHQSLRSAGCSENKAKAVRALASSVNNGEVPLRSLSRKSDDEIMETLLPLFGVGRWTVEMFLIFQLGRLDIWPVGDLGVRRGWEKLFKMREEIEISNLIKAGEKFSPYRSHLAWYCWRAHSLYS